VYKDFVILLYLKLLTGYFNDCVHVIMY
jgi:hypothetical protein